MIPREVFLAPKRIQLYCIFVIMLIYVNEPLISMTNSGEHRMTYDNIHNIFISHFMALVTNNDANALTAPHFHVRQRKLHVFDWQHTDGNEAHVMY